jgi:exosortase/archaeosortase family protein
VKALLPAGLLLLAAAWVAAWYARRVVWGVVEPYELVALATLAMFVVVRLRGSHRDLARELDGQRTNRVPRWDRVVVGALAIAAATAWLGELAAAMVVASVIALALAARVLGRASRVAAVVLALLALPIVPALQLHVGYPLRIVASEATAWLLDRGLRDVVVEARGPVLALDGALMLVDEPCSGVRALWLALYLGATLALLERLAATRTALLIGVGFVIVVALNVLRTLVLAYIDLGQRAAVPGSMQAVLMRWDALLGTERFHSALGLALAATLAAALAFVARRWGRAVEPSAPLPRASSTEPRDHAPRSVAKSTWSSLARGAAMSLALLAPLVRGGDEVSLEGFPGWPTSFEGVPLVALPAAPEDVLLAERFPGQLGRFRAGGCEVVLAWLAEPTVDVHAASLCFRGAGYDVTPSPAERTADDTLWSAFEATRGARHVLVRERVRDDHGRSWPDASAWWWSALFGRTHGPWWREIVVTIL